jgi:hypothetical protein
VKPTVIRKIQYRNRFLLTIIVTLSILIVGTLAYVLVNNLLPDDTSPPTANLGNTGYLKLPSLPSQDGENSRIFLVSATSTYGVHDGQNSLIINATLRNDYSAQQLPPDASSYPEPGTAYFILHTTLFDTKGTQINASEITDPHDVLFSGSPQHSL